MKINNLNIKGGSQQFADRIINNQNELSKSERELLGFINSKSVNEDKKTELMESFDIVRNDQQPAEKRKKAGSVLKNFLESGAKQAGKQIIQKLIKSGMEYIQFLT